MSHIKAKIAQKCSFLTTYSFYAQLMPNCLNSLIFMFYTGSNTRSGRHLLYKNLSHDRANIPWDFLSLLFDIAISRQKYHRACIARYSYLA